MNAVIDLLIANPLLYLFVVAAVGYPLGRVKIFGFSFGVAAVLFVGLAFGSLSPDLRLPEIVYIFGLVLFVYTIGLASGPAFVVSLRREGVKNNVFALVTLFLALGLTKALASALAIKTTLAAGMFSGGLTNTPALASLLETIRNNVPAEMIDTVISEPVVAYSIAYPVGVVGVMLAIVMAERLFRIDYAREAKKVKGFGGEEVEVLTLHITRPEADGKAIGPLCLEKGWNVMFGRIKRGGHFIVPGVETTLAMDDLLTAVGPAEDLAKVAETLGEVSGEHIERESAELQMRRLFVSNPEAAGRPLKDLDVHKKFGAVVTRIRRGDMDMVVNGKTVLELGDRIRVVAPYARMKEVSAFFGDSYRAVSEVDVMTFSLGLALGLAIGMIPIPAPGGAIRLGVAGGPLVAGLVLGARERTGPLVWNVPYGANMTLRQIGLLLFLAGVGTKAGYGFASTFLQGGGMSIFLAGAVITFGASMFALLAGRLLFGINFCVLTGMVAGLHTQPAVLAFAAERSRSDLANVGYAAIYPTATVVKIIMAQALLSPFISSL